MNVLSDALYAKLAANLGNELGKHNDGPAIFTAVPIPDGVTYPVVIAATTVSDMAADSMRVWGRSIERDISVYGKIPKDHEAVATIAEKIRRMFHREALDVAGFHVINVSARGPVSAPAEAGEVGMVVSLVVRMDPRST